MSDMITLFDMARKGGNNCWSPNVWKTRLVLNYKGLDYTTEWLMHPEIPLRLKELNVPHNLTGSPYTLPTICLQDGTYVMDSMVIATALEEAHPQPSLHLSNNLHNALGPILAKISFPLIPVFMPRIGRDIVPASAEAYFETTRSARFGMPLAKLEAEKGGDAAWEAAQPGLEDLRAFMRAHKQDEGPFVLGSEVCYADFVIVGMMESLKRIGPELFEKFVGGDEALMELHRACGKWMERDA